MIQIKPYQHVRVIFSTNIANCGYFKDSLAFISIFLNMVVCLGIYYVYDNDTL